MERLNRTTAPQAKTYTEKVIQFGEGNFLRAFIEWIIWKTNQKTDFNASVVVVQPIDRGMVDMLNEQDGLYHLNLQGLLDGKPVDSIDLIDVISRGINPYRDFQDYLKLAELPEMRFIISNTTEAGIAFDPACKFTDAPASSYPGKLVQLLYHRYECFKGDLSKGFIIFPCELIFLNGKHLKECIYQYIELWKLGEDFKNWFEKANLERTTLYDSENHVSYFDRGTRLYFAHDFAPGDDFALAYPAVREKYLRRIARFKKILSAAKSALVVWVADPRGNGEVVEDDIEYSLNALRAAYPKTDFMLLVANCVPGVPPEKMRVKRGKGYECLSFDYRVVTDGPPTWDIRTELFTPILDRFAAVDYRTRAEKRANARREKARAYVKFKADSPWTYFVNRLQFKLYRHFKRRLERKGVLSSIEPSCRTGGCH